VGSLTTTAGGDHAAVTMYDWLTHYPTRFVGEQNPFVTQALKSHKNAVPMLWLRVPHELIEEGDTGIVTAALRGMVSTRENVTAYRQRVGVMVNGYDSESRGIWQFPEAREFFRRLFAECPFVMILAHPDGGLLKLLAACWVYEDGLTADVEQQRTVEFLYRAFDGLNALNHTLALSEEQNREICESAMEVLFGEVPPRP
jgi:hypothetical protein